MSESTAMQRRPVERPDRAVRNEFVEPILVLAAQLAAKHPVHPHPERPIVEHLAELTGHRGFRERPDMQHLSERDACARLTTRRARKAALVVLSLVLKTDSSGGAAARAHFSGLREQLGLDAIVVPANVDAHLSLALEYLRD